MRIVFQGRIQRVAGWYELVCTDMKKDDVIVLLAGLSRRWGATRIGLRRGEGAVEYGNGPPAADDDDNDEILALIPVVSRSFWMPIVWLHYIYNMLFWIFVYLCGKVFVCKGVCVYMVLMRCKSIFVFLLTHSTITKVERDSYIYIYIERVVLMRGSVVALQSRIPTSPHCHPSAKWTKMMFLTKWP